MPDLRGKTKEEAEQILAQQGIPVVCEEEYNKEVEAGRVSNQSVEPETMIDATTQIILKISKGVEMFPVPDVTGLSEEEAIQKLVEAGYNKKKINVSKEYNNNVAAGLVISQKVAANTQVEKGSKITITVSQGAKAKSGGKQVSGAASGKSGGKSGGGSSKANDGWNWEEIE